MAYIKKEDSLSHEYVQVDEKMINTDDFKRILTSNNIRFELHLFELKIFDGVILMSNSKTQAFDLKDTLNKCIDVKSLDLSEANIIPQTIEDLLFIKTIILPTTLSFIPFIKNCTSLEYVRLPKHGIVSIQTKNFENYPGNLHLKFDNNLIHIGQGALSGSNTKELDLSQCHNLEPQNIKRGAFSCYNLEVVHFPEQINILPYCAFSGCKNLKVVCGSELLATYLDEYNENYVNLDRGVHSCQNCFEKCENLQFIQFSPQLTESGLNHLFRHHAYDADNIDNNSNSHYYDERCGIVLEIDSFYSYIWSFTDFRFYLAKRMNYEFLNKLVNFYANHERVIEFENGKCWIHSNHNDFLAIGLEKGFRYALNPKFNKPMNRLGAITIENDQYLAIKLLEKHIPIETIDIKEKITELESFVDNLDINSIIESYHSTRQDKSISRYRSDDEERISISRGSYYSDAYMDSLLPEEYYESRRGFAETNNNRLCDMSNKELKEEDEEKKEIARKCYDKKEHKRVLIKAYFDKILNDESIIENCLHIKEARKLLERFNNIDGSNRIITLNKSINIK